MLYCCKCEYTWHQIYFISLHTPKATDNTMVTTENDTPAKYLTDSNFCASIWVLSWATCTQKFKSHFSTFYKYTITSLSIRLLVSLISCTSVEAWVYNKTYYTPSPSVLYNSLPLWSALSQDWDQAVSLTVLWPLLPGMTHIAIMYCTALTTLLLWDYLEATH